MKSFAESLILAQDERWRRASHMQVVRGIPPSLLGWIPSGERVSNAWVTCPSDWDNPGKLGLIPDTVSSPHGHGTKGGLCLQATADGWARVPLASW